MKQWSNIIIIIINRTALTTQSNTKITRVQFGYQKKIVLKSNNSGLDKNVVTSLVICIIIHQTHYVKSDWSRAFNQFTIACELDMINVLSAADNAFIMSSSMSA